jgi:replicative DNA helicase
VQGRANHARFERFIKDYSVSKECYLIVQSIKDYYATYPTHTAIDWDLFETLFFLVKAKHLKEDTATICRKMLTEVKGLSHSPIPIPAADEVIKHYIKLSYAYSIAEQAASMVTGGTGDLDAIEDLIKKHDAEVGRVRFDDSTVFVSTKLSDVLKSVTEEGYHWRLKELNRSLGPLRTGDFIILAARPETGKTTFVASEIAHFATQVPTSRPILWINNEERSDKVMRRIIQAYFGITNKEMEADASTYDTRYQAEVGDRVRVVDNAAGMNNVRQLDRLFQEHNPSMIVFDQLDKVDGFGGEARDDLKLGKLYFWGRENAHKYGPVIAVSQVDGSGEGQKWINMSQLRGSKTDKAGEADAIITIGRSTDPHEEYNRYIHVPKNKLFGGPDSVESERHAYYEVKIDPTIARYKGVF